jgi:uncharacterized membrane protein YGL010W
MRRIDVLLDEYGASHQNKTNKTVHWVCVPLIVWSVTAVLWSLPVPALMAATGLNWMLVIFVLALAYYLFLSVPLAIGFLVFGMFCIAANLRLDALATPLWQIALVVFVLAWTGQFWGHKIEGKKPSFFKDVQFLLIGPAWLLSFLYIRLGVRF